MGDRLLILNGKFTFLVVHDIPCHDIDPGPKTMKNVNNLYTILLYLNKCYKIQTVDVIPCPTLTFLVRSQSSPNLSGPNFSGPQFFY